MKEEFAELRINASYLLVGCADSSFWGLPGPPSHVASVNDEEGLDGSKAIQASFNFYDASG